MKSRASVFVLAIGFLSGISAHAADIGAHPSGTGTLANRIQADATLLRQTTDRAWASRVVAFSTQYSADDWAAHQALGAPDTYPQYGDITTAWAPLTTEGQREFIELGFPQATAIEGLDIFETYNPGAIDRVDARDPDGQLHPIYLGSPQILPEEARIFQIRFPATAFLVQSVLISLDSPAVPGWNEIDAVGILPATPGTWQGIEVPPPVIGNAVVSTGKNEYSTDEAIVVLFSDLPGNQTDWITVVPAEFAADTYREWHYTEARKSGEMTFAPLSPGAYEVRVYFNWPANGYVIQVRHPFAVTASAPPLTPDFDGDGVVGFSDFLMFAAVFGSRQGDDRYQVKFDLDQNGEIGFSDFLVFAQAFGKPVG